MAYTTKSGRAEGWSPAAFTRARLDADLTLREIADLLGVSRSTVFNWQNTRVPMTRDMPKLAKLLRVPQAKLLSAGKRKGGRDGAE